MRQLLIGRQDGIQRDSRQNAQDAQKGRPFAPFALFCGNFALPVCSPSCGLLSKYMITNDHDKRVAIVCFHIAKDKLPILWAVRTEPLEPGRRPVRGK